METNKKQLIIETKEKILLINSKINELEHEEKELCYFLESLIHDLKNNY